VAISADDDGRKLGSGCKSCGARLAADQRYCLACGERRGAIPAAIAQWLSIVDPPEAANATPPATPDSAAGEESSTRSYMPAPRSAAIAVLTVLGFGVVLGGLTGPAAQSAGIAPIVLYSEAEPPPAAEPAPEPVTEASEPTTVAEAPATAEVPVEAEAPEETAAAPPQKRLPPELPEEEALPPVQHVFVIVLADHGFEETYGPSSTATYISKTLPEKGELLSNYYAVTTGDLANEIALLSGQGPNPATAADCPEYKDFATPTLNVTTGQAEGEGCVYSAETETLPTQLAAAKKSWKAYVGGIGNGQAGEPTTCRHPTIGTADPAQASRQGDPYETWRNPFVYFHSIVDSPECAERDVGLEQLSADLKKEAKTPSFSYIVPDACHDGSETPCEPGAPAGLAAAQPWLETTIAEIEASPAYKTSGLIAITSAQARQDLPEPDTSACCGTPEYPNLPAPEAAPVSTGPVKESGGGGRVGMLLLSPFVAPGSVNETAYYNHFSFLLSVGELLEVTPALGYAAEPVLTAFDSTVFNSEEAPADATAPASSRPGSRALRLPRRSHRERGRSGR
jgi:hypothetical protein